VLVSELASTPDVLRVAVERLRVAYERHDDIELPHLQTLAALREKDDGPTLRLIASLVGEIAPRHVIEFGCGASTELLALLAFDHGRMAVTTFEHDPWGARELLRAANPFATNNRWFTFCLCPLVARRVHGTPLPVYDDGMAVPAVPFPADIILVQGPPSALGGRAGALRQALAYVRPGTLILLLSLRRDEAEMVEAWAEAFSKNVCFGPPGLLDRHLAFVVQEPIGAPFLLEAPRAQDHADNTPNPAVAFG
jgi:hypothetical protein